MNNIETMKRALEALLEDRAWLESDAPKEAWDKNNQAITTLRQDIEQAQQAEPIVASEETQRFAIQVEKLLCEKLGRKWSPVGISIQTLVDELADRQTQQAEPVVGVFDYKEHAEGLQRDYDLLLAEYNDLKAQQAEPVAWRTFDGEGGYEFRDYDMNEDYGDWWAQRNPNHLNWVDPLYTSPPPRQPLTDEEILKVWEQAIVQDNGAHARLDNQPFVHFARAIEAKLRSKNNG